MKKTVLIAASVAAIGAIGVAGPTMIAHAATTGSQTNSTSATAKQRVNRRHIRVQARLNQAVRDGVITEAQKTAFMNELKTLKAQRGTDGITKSDSAADRQAERAKLKGELQSWASSNGFPLSRIMPKFAAGANNQT